jgi:hypothetical protein
MLRALTAGVRANACLLVAASLLFIAAHVSHARAGRGAGVVVSPGASLDGRTLIVRLRSFAPRASGRLEVEPTKGGGRVRLTALNMPPPQSLAPNARTFVAWASGGRILRLGELRRGSRGDASLVFAHPTEFARYSLIVTAERDARAERPTGAPVFSTRANEVAAHFPAPPPVEDSRAAAATARRERRAVPTPSRRNTGAPLPGLRGTTDTTTGTAGTNTPPRPAADATRPRPAATDNAAMTPPPAVATTALRIRESARAGGAEGEFFANVDEAIERDAGARTLVLVGDRGARRARGTARVAMQPDGTAYVRVRFRRVPKPSRFGRGRRYAMWALNPEESSTTYMGTLPSHDINRRQTYARTEGVNSSKFRLLVTAERRAAPAPRPAGRRVLMTFKGRRRK